MRIRWPVALLVALAGLNLAEGAVETVLLVTPYPELAALEAQPASAWVTDRHGTLLQVTPLADGSRRLNTSWDELPSVVREALFRAEDGAFFAHDGVNPVALLRALFQNAVAGRTVGGASTISMQLARMIHPRATSVADKLLEMIDARRLELRLPKTRIAELWWSHLPFTPRIVGVEAAAQGIFGVTLSQLSPEQASLLAVIPRRPSLYDPRLHPQDAVKAALRLNPDLSAEDLLRAAARVPHGSGFPREAPHYLLHLAATTPGGLTGRVETSLDLEWQHRLESSIVRHLGPWKDRRIRTGSGLILDNRSGEVRAWVGSADFDDVSHRGQVDGVLAHGQPGSALKPFLYALALERGFTANQVLADLPTDFGSSEVYSPTNFNGRFNGPVRLRVALASSLNVPAVAVLNRLGVRSFSLWLEKLGFASMVAQRQTVGVGLALGNAEVSLEELVTAFSVFPRGGLGLDGNPLMSAYTAGEIRSILSDQPSRFLGFGPSRILEPDFDAMFKTGTANQFQHVWALGATPEVTMGIWMGNFEGDTIIGRAGSSLPSQTLVDVLRDLELPRGRWPPVPESHEVRICTVSGGLSTDNCPATDVEHLPLGVTPAGCTWHTASGRLTLPEEYAGWAAKDGRSVSSARAPADGSGNSAEILSPADGTVYVDNPQKPSQAKALALKVRGSGARLARWQLDGALAGRLDATGQGSLPLRVGEHRLVVTLATGQVLTSRFSVRP